MYSDFDEDFLRKLDGTEDNIKKTDETYKEEAYGNMPNYYPPNLPYNKEPFIDYGPNPGYDNEKPKGAPPSQAPNKNPGLYRVDPGSIRNCKGSFTYIWLNNGRGFWIYPTYVGRTSLSGYRYTNYGWTYFGIDLKNIESFTCGI